VFLDASGTPFFDARPYAVPVGLFVIHFVAYILCVVVLVRERASQTLQRMFVAGFRRGEIVTGYVAAYSIVATLQAVVVLIELRVLFALSYDASTIAKIYLVMWLLAVTSIALGILVSSFARTEGQVLPFIPLVIIPSIFLSGILIPVSALPPWARALSRLVPLYYGTEAVRGLSGPAAPHSVWWHSAMIVSLYGMVLLVAAALTLREDA